MNESFTRRTFIRTVSVASAGLLIPSWARALTSEGGNERTPETAVQVSQALGTPEPSLPATVPSAGVFQLPSLPYAENALEPYISARTMSFHYGKHHRAYVDNLNKLVAGTRFADQTLEDIISQTAHVPIQRAIFNNAGQDWNHTFFWNSMKPGGGGRPTGRLLRMIEKSFGSFDKFRSAFVDAGVTQFGSGWAWLVQDGDKLTVISTPNADTPVAHGRNALLTCDVWEHAYYLDYQNRRKDFLEAFMDHLANWDFAASRIK